MEEVKIKNKQQYFSAFGSFMGHLKLTDKMYCIHCHKIIMVGDFKVYRTDDGFEMICCPNAPDCDGTMIDWMPPEFGLMMEGFSEN